MSETCRKLLVTGGDGFVGSHVSERLVADGFGVLVLDDFNDFYDPAIKRRRNGIQAEGPEPRGDGDESPASGCAAFLHGAPAGARMCSGLTAVDFIP